MVVGGSGSCFSAGADFKAQVQRGADTRLPHERSYAMYEPFLSVLDIDVPVMAAMKGHAVGGGFGLALLCDIRIASRTARHGANFCRLGLASGLGIGYVLPRLIGPSRAAELLYTGRLIGGDELVQIGLASRAVDAEAVLPAALDLAREIAASAPLGGARHQARPGRRAWLGRPPRRLARGLRPVGHRGHRGLPGGRRDPAGEVRAAVRREVVRISRAFTLGAMVDNQRRFGPTLVVIPSVRRERPGLPIEA